MTKKKGHRFFTDSFDINKINEHDKFKFQPTLFIIYMI